MQACIRILLCPCLRTLISLPSCMQLELSSWIGVDTVKALLCEKMPEAMRKDMVKLLEEQAPMRKAPQRFTRREQAARAAQQGAAADSSAGAGSSAPGGPVPNGGAVEAEDEVSRLPCMHVGLHEGKAGPSAAYLTGRE